MMLLKLGSWTHTKQLGTKDFEVGTWSSPALLEVFSFLPQTVSYLLQASIFHAPNETAPHWPAISPAPPVNIYTKKRWMFTNTDR